MADRERRPAAGIAIHLGENDAGDGQALVEFLGALDGVLPGHGVGDEQNLHWRELLFQFLQLDHQIFVDVQTPGRVDQQHVAAVVDGFPTRRASQLNRLGLFRRARINGETDVLGDHP